MTGATLTVPGDSLAERVREAIASVVGRPAASIADDMPLTLYGLDSVSALELVASLEGVAGRSLPEWFTAEHPTLGDLVRALHDDVPEPIDERALIAADTRLPADVIPPPGVPARPARHVLLTGATGFLGAYVLRELLATSGAHVHCLVRGARTGTARVKPNLEQYRLWDSGFAHRVTEVEGDITQPLLGMSPAAYRRLAANVDVVFHVAGDVSWVQPYTALRATNVLGTTEVMRFLATGRAKALQFLSSLSVCYAVDGPPVVDERMDMLPHVHDLALGYAKTKVVAESLIHQAHRRGFDVRIYRPSIIVGDAATGASNLDDIVAALLKGCIQMGTAPDLDWVLDGPPVDHVARAVVRLSGRCAPEDAYVTHLSADRPRHWRECLLWTNLFGYPVRLVPFAAWQAQLRLEADHPEHPLHALRPFFLRPVSGGLTSAELFEKCRRSATAVGVDCPRLDARTLDRYFSDYTARGFLPPAPGREVRSGRSASTLSDVEARFGPLLAAHFADPQLRIEAGTLAERGSDHSIVSELTSWRRDQAHGLFRYTLDVRSTSAPASLGVVAKCKPSDHDVIEVAEAVAGMCDRDLAGAMRAHRAALGLRGTHLREQGIYAAAPDDVRRHLPVCFGTWRDDDTQAHGLVLETLTHTELLDAADDPGRWTREHRDAAVAGLARLHAGWYPRVTALRGEAWLGDVASAQTMEASRPLWRALALHAAPYVEAWADARTARTHLALVDSVAEWWPALEASPQTVIHHDFNPRNVCLRRVGDAPHLCAYDWELATIGAPQRDLVEFLCFTLPPDCARESFDVHVEDHRARFSQALGIPIDCTVWHSGVRSALADFLIRRLAFYTMVQRVRPQRFLPRVMRTWAHLFDLAGGTCG